MNIALEIETFQGNLSLDGETFKHAYVPRFFRIERIEKIMEISECGMTKDKNSRETRSVQKKAILTLGKSRRKTFGKSNFRTSLFRKFFFLRTINDQGNQRVDLIVTGDFLIPKNFRLKSTFPG